MNLISIIVVIFSMLAAADRIFGGKLGLSKEFEKGFMLLGTMALSMIGMIVISPFIADVLSPCFDLVYKAFGIDPSVIPAILFANDMGGAPLAKEVAQNADIGMFNALVVSSMMGATISFTIPLSLGMVKKELHRELLLGLLCGIVTIPIGCFVSGLMLSLPISTLLYNLLPLLIFGIVIAVGLVFIPDLCARIFSILGVIIKILITIGLALGILKSMTGLEPIKGLADIKEAALICFNASIVMSGAFPLLSLLSKLLKKPLKKLGDLMGINEISATGFISTIATNVTTFGMMNEMDKKGTFLNSAFAVSAAFTFAGHLAFTLAFDANYVSAVIAGKLISGAFALAVAILIYKRISK